jgi:hypothetical protein
MFNFAVEYSTKKVHESRGGLEMSGLNQVVLDADDTLLGMNMQICRVNQKRYPV